MGVATKQALTDQETKPEEIKVGIELPAHLHHHLKVEAAKRNLKMKEVFREALENWLTPSKTARMTNFAVRWRLPTK